MTPTDGFSVEASHEAVRRAVSMIRATIDDDVAAFAAAGLGWNVELLAIALAHVGAQLVEGLAEVTGVAPGALLDALVDAEGST